MKRKKKKYKLALLAPHPVSYQAQLNQNKQDIWQGATSAVGDSLGLFMNMNTSGYGFDGKLKRK
jgi:hypothetical protein